MITTPPHTRPGIFLYIFLYFAKINGPLSVRILQNYTPTAVAHGGRDIPLCGTAVGAVTHDQTWTRGVLAVNFIWRSQFSYRDLSFHFMFKKLQLFFCINSDGGKLYMKIVALIYNFVVQKFFI
jgi:hypothetical protein